MGRPDVGSTPVVRRLFGDPVRTFIGALAVLAAASASTAALLPSGPSRLTTGAIALLAALVVAAEVLVVRISYRGDVMAVSLGEAMLAPAIFLSSATPVLMIAAVSQIASGVVHRIGVRKTVFNVAQWVLQASAGTMVMRALRDGDAISYRNVTALVVAMTAIVAVNSGSLTAVIALSQRRPPVDVARGIVPALTFGWGINTAFGILFVTTGLHAPFAMGLFAVPLFVLHWASRGHAAALADRTRLGAMHRAMRILTTPIDPQDAIPRFLSVVRGCFASEASMLVLVRDGARIVHVARGDGDEVERFVDEADDSVAAALNIRAAATLVGPRYPDPALAPLLAREGWRDCIAAPLRSDEGAFGVLAVLDRSGAEGFEEGELAVLEALAAEAAGAIQKGVLLERLLEERRKLADVVETTTDGILMIDATGAVLMWNPGLEQITGYLGAEMLGGRMLTGLLPRDADGNVVQLEAGVDPAVSLPSDLQIVTRNGETRWLSCSYTRIPSGDGREQALIVVARDTTRTRELERLKEDFVATVSHELRTPLTPIKGWAATLVDAGDKLGPRERAAAARSILRQAEGLERLIVNLLEVAKIERGVIDLRDAVVDVKDVVAKVVHDALQQHPGRKVRVEAARAGCRARGDEIWVERIVANLVSNALKYAPPDEPIDIAIVEAPGETRISVTDRGPGIPAHERERIFERFQRLGDHMTRSTGGTGLGLYIARQLAQALGGSLAVSSEPGKGATFTLTLRATGQLVAVGSTA